MKFAAGIVTYNPDPVRLSDNINSIIEQVDCVIIFDNGNGIECINDINKDKIVILSKGYNVGVAEALNAICNYAIKNDFEWVYCLDQDSVSTYGIIKEYSMFVDNPDVAILCPTIRDRNYGSMYYDQGLDEPTTEIDSCITAGSFLKLSVWQEVGGFWEDLFIDMVDFDYCWSVKEKGYKILRVNSQTIIQEIGHSKLVSLFGKENVVFNHSPQRCYYMIRNTLMVGKKHNRKWQCFRWTFKRTLLINLFESNKLKKDKFILKGVIDYIRFKQK